MAEFVRDPNIDNIPAARGEWMERATIENLLAVPPMPVPGRDEDIPFALVNFGARFMIGRADNRFPFIVERVEKQHDGVTKVWILVGNTETQTCYRNEYNIESLAQVAWIRPSDYFTRKRYRAYTFEEAVSRLGGGFVRAKNADPRLGKGWIRVDSVYKDDNDVVHIMVKGTPFYLDSLLDYFEQIDENGEATPCGMVQEVTL